MEEMGGRNEGTLEGFTGAAGTAGTASLAFEVEDVDATGGRAMGCCCCCCRERGPAAVTVEAGDAPTTSRRDLEMRRPEAEEVDADADADADVPFAVASVSEAIEGGTAAGTAVPAAVAVAEAFDWPLLLCIDTSCVRASGDVAAMRSLAISLPMVRRTLSTLTPPTVALYSGPYGDWNTLGTEAVPARW